MGRAPDGAARKGGGPVAAWGARPGSGGGSVAGRDDGGIVAGGGIVGGCAMVRGGAVRATGGSGEATGTSNCDGGTRAVGICAVGLKPAARGVVCGVGIAVGRCVGT